MKRYLRHLLKKSKERSTQYMAGISIVITLGTDEPVFANIRHALGLRRFTLRGELAVDIQ